MLREDDGSPVHVTRRDNPDWIVVCDHASSRLPVSLGSLGLDKSSLLTHIGWDIGALYVAEWVASQMNATLVAGGFSRLVIDCNRHVDDPASIPAVSGGITIPGNAALPDAERRARIDEIYLPYHRALTAELDRIDVGERSPVLLAIHSCAAHWNGEHRPWELGISWRGDDRIARPVLASLNARGDIVVGDNKPYDLDPTEDFTTPEHAMRRGLAHLQVEFRQDLVGTRADAEHWASILLSSLAHNSQDDWHERDHSRMPSLRHHAKILGPEPWCR